MSIIKRFPEPQEGSIFYEDDFVYACLAFDPITEGHTIVVWKNGVFDLNILSPKEYNYLMKKIFRIRKVLMDIYKTDKVYLVYLDEKNYVHWHLFPRKPDGLKGFKLLSQKHGKLTDLSKISLLQKALR